MKTLKELRKDMQFNHELGSLIEVLKGIASSEFRHLQSKREYNTRFIRCMDGIFEGINLIHSDHPFMQKETGSGKEQESHLKTGIVMVTSDEGFLGELNSQVVNIGLSCREPADELIILGERGAHFLDGMKESYFYFPGIPEDISFEQAQNLRNYLIQRYLKKQFQKVIIVYPKFISFAIQKVEPEQLLPYVPVSVEEAAPGHLELLTEPTFERIVDYLIRIWLGQRIFDIFWDSKLSELASRVIHLEGSTQAISEISKKLKFNYFRTVHQLSDKNIREIFASRLIEQ